MTLAEIIQSDALMLTPADVAPVLGVDPQKIRVQAKQNPALLGFNVVVVGSRTIIPRKSFLSFIGETDGS